MCIYVCVYQVLFPNEAVAMILARIVAVLGPIETEMLEKGQETHKYFTKEYDLYHLNEVIFLNITKKTWVLLLECDALFFI